MSVEPTIKSIGCPTCDTPLDLVINYKSTPCRSQPPIITVIPDFDGFKDTVRAHVAADPAAHQWAGVDHLVDQPTP